MEGRQRRSFMDDYKRQAVDLVASSSRSIGSAAALDRDLCRSSDMRFRFIEDRRADYPVTILCDVLGVSPAGYYAWRSRRRASDPRPTVRSLTTSSRSIATPADAMAARASMPS